MYTRLTEASFAYRETMKTMEQQIKPVICPKASLDVSPFFFFFNSVERKLCKRKKKLFSERIKKIFVTVYLTRSHAYARPRSVKAIPFAP